MASTLNASTSGVGGIITTADNSGNLNLQSGGVTKASITSSGVSLPTPLAAASGGTGLSSVGTSGNLLTSNGTAWVSSAPPASGKVLQVVSTTFSDASNIASTSYTDVSGGSLSITPTSATSKILVIVNITCQIRYDATGHQQGDLQLLRAGSSIREFGRVILDYYIPYSSTALLIGGMPCFSYLDSPATTSATTYSMKARCLTTSSTGRITINEAGSGSHSTITLMEIAA
jgi:hypothetical protein